MSNTNTAKASLRQSEAGMISIMTTMVLMIVISLIVLGFAQLSRRNQRETLDRQLSTQAFYAAESGVNDVRQLIQDAVAGGSATVPEKNGCTDTGTGGFYASLSPTIDSATDVQYTCLLVDPSPETLRYSEIGSTSTVVPLVSASGQPINEVTLTWQSKISGTNPLTGCPTTTQFVFSPTASWNCGYGVLRFDIVPTAGLLNIDGLRTSTMTAFGVPYATGGGTTTPYTLNGANNNRLGISCNATRCSLRITGLSANSYHMRISSIYRSVALQITATGPGGVGLELEGAQAIIDSTGRAQDVLRRIQVHVPLRASSQNQLSDYAIQTTDAICKRFSVMDGYFNTETSGITSTNRLCQP